jgi:hypothetical protein
MIISTSPSGRRPLVFILIATIFFALVSLHTFYGIQKTGSLLATYTTSPSLPNITSSTPAYTSFSPAATTPPWLILTISAASHLQRRQIIRSTWLRTFSDPSIFTARFVISDPGPLWRPFVQQENDTYGDIIMLPHEHETHWWANSVKTMEALQWLVERKMKYDFVTKMDEDSWVDVKAFWRWWLEPRMRRAKEEGKGASGTYIGRSLQHDYPFRYASGQFYTMSWDLVEVTTKQYMADPITDEHEDVLTGKLMYEAKYLYNLTVLPLRVAFDYYDDQARGDGTAWAPEDQDVDDSLYHGIAPGSVNPHQLKDDESYLRVAACYDSQGLKGGDDGVEWEKLSTISEPAYEPYW